MAALNSFPERLLAWFDEHGRKDLPWQQDINPYRVWVSEIMLQQTQVATATPYYLAFMQRFPNVEALAEAPIDDVLHHWSGLGYYARARNLHRAAQRIVEEHQGELPATQEALEALPGIGRSTAAAILSIAFRQAATILDGNVKRVLARHRAIPGWPGHTAAHKALWQAAETFTPEARNHHYTQAIMDLGASLCSRSKPQCEQCPVAEDCIAYKRSEQSLYPGKKPKKALPVKQAKYLLLENAQGHILLKQRPAEGIWGSLWCPPTEDELSTLPKYMAAGASSLQDESVLCAFRHSFSHYHLDITAYHQQLSGKGVMEGEDLLWYNPRSPQTVGLAAPVSKMLRALDAAQKALL